MDSCTFYAMAALLDRWDEINNNDHGKHCHNQRKHLYLFIIYVDSMLGREALVILANLSQLMAEKMDEPILHVQGWISGQIKIIVAR